MIEWSDIRDIDINYCICTSIYVFFANFKSLVQNNFTRKSTIQMGKISFSSYVWGQVIHWTRARLDRCIRMSNFISVDFIKSEHVVAFWKCVCNFFFYIYRYSFCVFFERSMIVHDLSSSSYKMAIWWLQGRMVFSMQRRTHQLANIHWVARWNPSVASWTSKNKHTSSVRLWVHYLKTMHMGIGNYNRITARANQSTLWFSPVCYKMFDPHNERYCIGNRLVLRLVHYIFRK